MKTLESNKNGTLNIKTKGRWRGILLRAINAGIYTMSECFKNTHFWVVSDGEYFEWDESLYDDKIHFFKSYYQFPSIGFPPLISLIGY